MSEEQTPITEPVVAEQTTTETTSNFMDSLPEDLRNDPSLKDFKDVEGLAKSYTSAQKMLGSSLRIPGEDASEDAKLEFYNKLQSVDGVTKLPNPENQDELSAFYRQLGRPETAEQYDFKATQDQEVNNDALAQFKDLAFGLNLTNEQADKLIDFEMQRGQGQNEQQQESLEKGTAQLKEKWGPDYDNRLSGAKAALSMYKEQFPEAVAELESGPMGNNPAVISMLSELYGALKETGAAVPHSTANTYGTSSEEAQVKIGEIMENTAHAYWNDNDPGHKAAVSRMQKLNTIVYGNE